LTIPRPAVAVSRAVPVLLAGWCAFVLLYGVASGALYRTESLRAIIGRSCFDGNWLYPVLYGEPFLTKPPGHYVAIGLCSLPFGAVSETSARLPSVFAAIVAVLCMFSLFRRVLNDRAAVLVAAVLPCSVLWLDKVPSAEIDMSLVGWVTAAIVLFHRALESERAVWWVASLVCVAGGTLTKWTAPAFFYLTVISLLAWRRRLALLFGWRHLLAVAGAGALCALWAFAVVQQVGWDALSDTIRKEAAYRFAPKASKGYPWGELATYPLLVFAAHLPVSAFALLTFRRSVREQFDSRGQLLLQLLHCWTWPNLLFWTLVPNHNIRYALPLSAGLMGLGVMGLLALTRHNPRACVRGVVAFLALWCVVKITFVEVAIPRRANGRNAENTASEMRSRVPPGQPVYLFKLKDEGVMFYYGRSAIRARDPHSLPPGAVAILIRQEWEDRTAFGHLHLLHCMNDQQGDPIYLVQQP
jgi:4-amino-4-deoxy-L-arabinose transferase-like glycosyltransferase